MVNLESREAKTDLFFPTASLSPLSLITLRTKAGGEMYIFVAHEIASTCGFPFIGEKYPILQHMGKEKKEMCQGSCLMGFLLDHKSLKIGAFDVERSFTCCRLVELCEEVVNFKNEIDKKEEARMFGEEFHILGHIFLCIEHALGLQMQNGHIELSVALTKLASIVPILVFGCVMLCKDGDNFGAPPLKVARAWA
ncbi:hypothetical protein CY35_17G047400 [Sphagnum magellanicum]|nr:hypothetical protein CY35_17G047400 [Sphagnum magellanicum]